MKDAETSWLLSQNFHQVGYNQQEEKFEDFLSETVVMNFRYFPFFSPQRMPTTMGEMNEVINKDIPPVGVGEYFLVYGENQ